MKRVYLLLIALMPMRFFLQDLDAKDWTVDVVVAQDGSGDYTTITEAIDNNPNDGSDYVIFIRNGTYDEKLFITENRITLLGEDRDSTIITQAILRRIFWETNDNSDWGVATINVGDYVMDLTLANLTIRNNFADLNPDVPDNNDHTMAIRGGGDRIIIVNCNIIATGGDTLSLWNTDGGRFYHSGCYFEGYVDYVCPRGFCYISNSDFFGYNRNTSIWHDGSGGKDQKLVVRNSWFDGVEFGLGRFHRMSAFYLLDCDFSDEMVNNGGIIYVGDSTVQDRDRLVYGVRTYYDRCTRVTGNYEWHADNLQTAEGSPSREQITDTWTFMDTWDPENSIYNLLECAFLPHPAYHEKDVDMLPELSWLPGKNAVKHLVYFGSDSIPELVAEVTDSVYQLEGSLGCARYYYWRIDEIDEEGDTIPGRLWTFSTRVSGLAAPATDPYPPVGDDFRIYTVHLQWQANMLEVDTFLVYFGSADDLDLIARQKNADLYLFDLISDTVYYWRVDIKNAYGITEGPLWYFNYRKSTVSSFEGSPQEYDTFKVYPNPASSEITIDLQSGENKKISIAFYNGLGQRVYKKVLEQQAERDNTYRIVFGNSTGIPVTSGFYWLHIDNGSRTLTYPLVVL